MLTRALWIAEGVTDYYAGLLVKRAGLSTRDEYLEELTGQIEAVQNAPGRLVTSVDMASYDTWIKQYRPDENTANTTVNYYLAAGQSSRSSHAARCDARFRARPRVAPRG